MRQPAVADRFYPGSPQKLANEVASLFSGVKPANKIKAFGVICPHAGYIYSGKTAAETLGSVHIPETIIIIGPNHHGRGAEIALSCTPWQMPFGIVDIDTVVAELLLAEEPSIATDEQAHIFEHSLEVQLPLLYHRQPRLKIVPLVVSNISTQRCLSIGEAIGRAIHKAEKEILILASSDMNHYESRLKTGEKDHQAIRAIAKMNPELLLETVRNNRITMCGVIPAAITMQAANYLGAKRSLLIGYTDSGYVNGDTHQVVGYAGIAFL